MADAQGIGLPALARHMAHASERNWAIVMTAILAVVLGVVVYTAIALGDQPPSHLETIDAARLQLGGEFAEPNLGTRVENDGAVTVRLVAHQYAFVPNCILVPADTPVTIRGTSGDVVHGFLVQGTNANVMLIPGYVATMRTSFPQAGEKLMPCHEYCGTGHQAMWARVQVVDRNTFPFEKARTESVSCAR